MEYFFHLIAFGANTIYNITRKSFNAERESTLYRLMGNGHPYERYHERDN